MNDQTAISPVLQLSPSAVEEIRALRERPDNAGKTLRVYVEQGGCSGMQYGLVFDEPRDGDESAEVDGVRVLVDAFSAKYLRGSLVDYSSDLTSGGFKLTNPNAQESCGCGKSFKA